MTERAVVAISEDRQWLVVNHDAECFVVYLRDGIDIEASWQYWEQVEDTGQSADEVLAAWLAERS